MILEGKNGIIAFADTSFVSESEYAGVAELADAPDLGSGVPDVQVQVLSPARKRKGLKSRILLEIKGFEPFFVMKLS